MPYPHVDAQAAGSYHGLADPRGRRCTATKSLDDKAIGRGCKKNRVDTIQGKLRFDGPSNYGDDLMQVKQVQNGKWVVVWPKEFAAAPRRPPAAALNRGAMR